MFTYRLSLFFTCGILLFLTSIFNQLILFNMNTEYLRVIPRDLFNEAKLLKCVGHLVLQIHDNNNPATVSFQHDGEAFMIGLLDEGYLSIANIEFTINNTNVQFVSQYNSKNNYTLFAYYDYCEYLVFDETGIFTSEFLEFTATL